MSKNKINHEIGLPILFVACSIVALWTYCIVASFLGWIEAIWWGGEAMFVPVVGSVIILICAVFLYWIIASLWNRSILIDYYQLAFVGFAFGFSFFPVMELLAIIKVKKQFTPLSFGLENFISWILLSMTLSLILNWFILWIRKLFSKGIEI